MATRETKDGLGYIIQAISNIVEPKVANLRYDKTYRAKVTEKVDAGIYKVEVNRAEYQLKYNGDLSVGDIVRVKAPLNNFSDIYIEAEPSTGGGSGGTSNYNDLFNKPILNTNNTEAQPVNEKETIKGTVKLHKISKTGNYNDLNNKPSLNFIPISDKGVANGVATLGNDLKIPVSQLPDNLVTDKDYVHTDNNYTTADKNKLAGIEAQAQVNTIEKIQQNGTDLTITNKTVNIVTPTKTSDLSNDSGFLTTLPIASTTTLGGVKIGDNLSITSDGVLSATSGGSGDANKLVKTYSLGEDANSFTIDGLDIQGDGGIYDIDIQFYQQITNATAVRLNINGITSNNYNYAGMSVIGDSKPSQEYSKQQGFYRLGVLRGNFTAFCRLTIVEHQYSNTRFAITSSMFSDGDDLNFENIAGQLTVTGNPNLTSITITCSSSSEKFLANGTRVKIYKR